MKKISNVEKGIKITWSKSDGAAEYRIFRKTDALAPLREGGRRIGVSQFLFVQRFIDGGHLHPGPVGIPGLVAVQRRTARPLLQFFRRALQDRTDGRMIRDHIGGQQLRSVVHALPEIVGQQRNRIFLLQNHRIPRFKGKGHRPFDPFGEVGQIGGGRKDFDAVQDGLSFGYRAQNSVISAREWRIETDGQSDVGQGVFLRVPEDDTSHRRYAVLHAGVAEVSGIVGFNGHFQDA